MDEKSIFVYKMDFQTIRLYGSMAVILGCFIFLYPKLLHPVVMTLFGMNTKVEKNTDDFIPPSLRDRHTQMNRQNSQHGGPDVSDHIKKNMRNGPHPGMRAAAAEQSKQTKGSGRGMMGVILPMYAVGIVVYLVYTLFKVFGKKDYKKEREGSPSPQHTPQHRRSSHQASDDEGTVQQKSGDPMNPQQLQTQLNELQSLANRVKQKDSTDMDMGKLQERLAETEIQMTKILQAMQSMQTQVGNVKPPGTEEEATVEESGDQAQQTSTSQENKQEVLNASDGSGESTESESYEIINRSDKSDRESNSGDDVSPIKVETLKSTASEQVEEGEGEEESGEEENEGEPNDRTGESEEAEETEDVMMEEKKDEDDANKNVTVRKRVTTKEDSSES